MVGDQLREKTGILEVVWRRFLVMERPWGSADKVNSHSYLYTNKKSQYSHLSFPDSSSNSFPSRRTWLHSLVRVQAELQQQEAGREETLGELQVEKPKPDKVSLI